MSYFDQALYNLRSTWFDNWNGQRNEMESRMQWVFQFQCLVVTSKHNENLKVLILNVKYISQKTYEKLQKRQGYTKILVSKELKRNKHYFPFQFSSWI